MNRFFVTVGCLFLLACSDQSHSETSDTDDTDPTICAFTFEGADPCRVDIDGRPAEIDLDMGPATDDERPLIALTLEVNDTQHRLEMSEGVTVIDGDRGYIQLVDINFDGIKDIAITTSFGVANLYLDYWVYLPEEKTFEYLGNYPQLTPDEDTQTLEARVRQSAEDYDYQKWVWQQGELIPASLDNSD